MRTADYLKLALHNIGRQKLRSALTVFAIVIGATSVTIMLTIVFSAKSFINTQFENLGIYNQVQVSPQQNISFGSGNQGGNCSTCVKITDDVVDQISKLPHVEAVTRETSVNNFDGLFYGTTKLQVQQMVAYDANGVITNHMLAGRDINSIDTTGVITITSDYADALGFKHNYRALIGKTVTLHAQSYYSGIGSDPLAQYQYQQQNCNQPNVPCNSPPTEIAAKVIGIVSSGGIAGGNNYTIRVPIPWAEGMEENQNYSLSPCNNSIGPRICSSKLVLNVTNQLALNGWSSLVVKVDNSNFATKVANQITGQFKLGAAAGVTQIKSILDAFDAIGAILGAIGGIALAVAAVGIVNTMVMAILERTREIGIMRAVGAKRSTVSRLFTIEASLLGLMGGALGLLIGYGLTLAGNPLINQALKKDGVTSTNILALPGWLIVGVIVGTTLIGVLSGLYPARRAAKLDPVEALRYE